MIKDEISKRIRCPYCSEKIVSDASKCRYCGEWLGKKTESSESSFINKALNYKVLLVVWVVTLLLFDILLILNDFDFSNSQIESGIALLVVVSIGSVVFIALGIELLKLTLNKRSWRKGLKYTLITALVFAAFIGTFYLIPNESITRTKTLGPDEVVAAVNEERSKNGTKSVILNPELTSTAKSIANDMCQNDYFNFPRSEEFDLPYFMDKSGYQYEIANYAAAEGFKDAQLLIEYLVENENLKNTVIISEDYEEIGVGIVSCGMESLNKTTDLIVQVYASPIDSKSSGAASAAKPSSNVFKTSTNNTVTCIGPDDKKFETTKGECERLNTEWGQEVDYMTNCNIHPDCGGGTVYMSLSQCNKPCSGIKQANNNSTNTPSSTKIDNTSNNSGSNTLCVNNVTGNTYYTTSGEQCNADNAKASCLDASNKIYELCMDNCLQAADSDSAYCIYNLESPERESCLETKDKEHQICMDKCADESYARNDLCY